MDINNLVNMANRIGEFFQAMPDHQEAKDGIALHIRRFWEPRMRRALLQHIDKADGAGLDALVLQAVREKREELTPAPAVTK